MKTNDKMDKDRFRLDLGGEVEAYTEVARRLGLLPEGSVSTVLDLDEHRKARGSSAIREADGVGRSRPARLRPTFQA